MLTNVRTPDGPNGSNTFSGPALKKMLRGASPSERARVAAYLHQTNASFENLSPAQTARLCGANQGSVSVELGNAGTRGPRPKTLDRLLKRYGPDVLLRAVDMHTAPKPKPAVTVPAVAAE